MKKIKTPSSTLKSIEKLFGPTLPGPSEPERTISVFQEYTSPKKYELFGRLGIIEGAIWHLHTQLPITSPKIKARISGIIEEGSQYDPYRRQEAAKWLDDYKTAEVQKTNEATRKAEAADAKKAAALRKKEEKEEKKRQKAFLEAQKQKQDEELLNARAERASKLAGEYDAKLMIGGLINRTLDVRVKIDAKGKISLAIPKGKKLLLPIAD